MIKNFKLNMKTICVIGVGYVGEHLLTNFKRKYNVICVDISQERIKLLKEKYPDVTFHSDFHDSISYSDVFLVSVPTLVDKNKQINLGPLHAVKEKLLHLARPGSLVMVESSVYIGATREIFGILRNKGIYVGFSPERVDPGRTEPPMEEIPKVISGLDPQSLQVCKDIYKSVFNKVVPVSSPETAEMCKLYENCFRMVNIAYVNEIADLCGNLGIDVHEMIDAASTKPFGFMPFRPGVGVGGHCIPVNPYYLFKSGDLPVLRYSTTLMENRPIEKAREIVEKYNPSNILITDIGFKKGESLLTNSPRYTLYLQLKALGKNVKVYDPIVQKHNKNVSDITFVDTLDRSEYDYII